jgi:eukaryotic-like serine/threonine-protein kinase
MTQETTPFSSTGRETMPTAPAPPDDPFPGEFRLVRLLGRGAFGEVWLADDLSPLDRQVALKFMRLANARRSESQTLAILQNDARLLASLRHPNIVPVYAWRQVASSGLPCLVMQYVPGGSLEQLVGREGALPWPLAARYVADVADGLLLVHGKGIIHRDVKPANMLLDPESEFRFVHNLNDSSQALLTDFGIAARLADPRTVAGTPYYMAPEAFRGEVSPALDVYGLAASLFWLVAGNPPFAGDDVTALTSNIEAGLPLVDARFAPLPEPLEQLIRAGLHADPACRPSLDDFVLHLRGALNLLLADCLTLPANATRPDSPVNLRLLVSRQVGEHSGVPVASSVRQPERILRDLKRVPRAPERVQLRTGDRVRLEVEADRPGYVTVFNIGPTGNLNLLCPDEPGSAPPLLAPNRPLHLADVELTPPAGNERLVAVWTRQLVPLRLEELRSLVEQDTIPGTSRRRAATRDMVRVQQSLEQIAPQDRHTVVLELDHL